MTRRKSLAAVYPLNADALSVEDFFQIYLQQAKRAVLRLMKAKADHDESDLHDLRVALRHLRVFCQLYSDTGKLISERQQKRLRKFSAASNHARDLEVIKTFIEECRNGKSQAQFSEIRSIINRTLESEAHRLRKDLYPNLLRFLKKIRRKRIAERQSRHEKRRNRNRANSFGAVAAMQLRNFIGRLELQLMVARVSMDIKVLHEVRITCKQMRYLLEPFKDMPKVNACLTRLTEIQDVLGALNDAQVMVEYLQSLLFHDSPHYQTNKSFLREIMDLLREAIYERNRHRRIITLAWLDRMFDEIMCGCKTLSRVIDLSQA